MTNRSVLREGWSLFVTIAISSNVPSVCIVELFVGLRVLPDSRVPSESFYENVEQHFLPYFFLTDSIRL